jgi:hypothetical protein
MRSAVPLFELHLRLEHCPAKPSQPAGAGRLLSWASAPYSTSGLEGPHHTGFACPLRSAHRVWLPSRRFTPFVPLPVLFHTGDSHGIPPSELSPLKRYPDVSARTNPPTVLLSVLPETEVPGRPAGPRFLGFDPLESPFRSAARLTLRSPDAPLGFPLSGHSSEDLERTLARSPLSRFASSDR